MLKRIFSVILSSLLLATVCSPLSFTAVKAETSTAPTILMNGEILTANTSLEYIYTVESLEDIPVLSCDFDRNEYSALITQPERSNGYTGTVTLTLLKDGTSVIHTVKVYDNNTFKSHFINLGGDPWVTYVDGWYYYMYTGNGFYISRSKDLSRVNSNPVSVFKTADLIDNVNFSILKELWAPELHFIDGHWYIYFTAYDGESYKENSTTAVTGTAKNHRMYVLKSETAEYNSAYTFMGQLKEVESDYSTDSGWLNANYNIKDCHWAIDQSIFEWNGKLYAVWSGWSGYDNIDQRIFIAEMSDPCTISSKRTMLSRPEFAYETYSVIPAINEGPQALISPDGKTLNIAFSVNRFDDSHYSLGLLTLKSGGNPLNADDWSKTEDPVFEPNAEKSTYSVGHCSFVPSPDGNEHFVVYHARRGEDTDTNPREIRVQQFYWNEDGTPCFKDAVSATDLVEIPSGTAKFNITTFEAENGEISGNAFIPTLENTNIKTYDADYYSGGSRVALTSANSSVTFTYNAKVGGKYTLSLLAASNYSSTAGFKITVNGTDYTKVLGGNSSNLNNFAYYDLNGIDLVSGENTITVAYTSTYKNGGYLDKLDIWNEDEANSAIVKQESENLTVESNPVIVPRVQEQINVNPEFNTEYTFNDFGDFDKYWFSGQPFVDDPEYENVITTCRTGGNKRLFVSGKEFRNIANFKSSVEIIPAATHYNSLNPSIDVADETAINAGILFHIGKMTDYTSNVCSFDGYRCFLKVSDAGTVVMQLSRYYFASETATISTPCSIKTASGSLPYTAGDKYIIELSCIDNVVNAIAYNAKDPDTVIKIENQSIETSVAETVDSGRIGLFVNCLSRVTFSNLKVTPYASSAGISSYYGNLNDLNSYDEYIYETRATNETNGVFSIPTGVTKLLASDEKAQNVTNFTAKSRIKISNTSANIQSGIAFRVGDAVSTSSSAGITGYVVYLQRTGAFTGSNLKKLNISLTKYGTNAKGTTNQNLGTSPNHNFTLLSDKTSISEIVGTEFDFEVSVLNNLLTVTVTRADNPALSATYSWVLDSKDLYINTNISDVYYPSGRIGIFSNGVVEMSDIEFNPLAEEYEIKTESQNGSISLNTAKTEFGNTVTATLKADNGYYLNPKKLTVTLNNGTTITPETQKCYWDTSGVFSFVLPKDTVAVNCDFENVILGDSNADTKTDIRDLIRTKKYLANLTEEIALTNTDSDSNKKIDASDLTEIRKQLLNK